MISSLIYHPNSFGSNNYRLKPFRVWMTPQMHGMELQDFVFPCWVVGFGLIFSGYSLILPFLNRNAHSVPVCAEAGLDFLI